MKSAARFVIRERDIMERDLDEALALYDESDIYPFHMPGHKRQRLGDQPPEATDITEVEGFDNLHHAVGILREAQERLARVFGADESFYLVGGSTAGILASVCGCMEKGGRLLIARNCHKSVYHAAYLMEAELSYLFPEETGCEIRGSIAPGDVEEALRRFPDTRAVVITSPTYDGVVSDIGATADIVHARDIPLIVDEAHGAHFGFSDGFPQKAVALGADLCVESLHKTLPAYTQSAALHMMKTGGTSGDGYRFNRERVRRYLEIFQSSSPSYVLMAGMERCVRMVREDARLYRSPDTRADSLFGQFEERLARFYGECVRLRTVSVFPEESDGIYARDPSKILISAQGAGIGGQELYDLLLERYHLQMEMAAGSYVTALTTIMDTDEGFERLLSALLEIDGGSDGATADDTEVMTFPGTLGQKRMEIAQAMDSRTAALPLSRAVGRISAELVYLYPPGVPILVPGEVITQEAVDLLAACRSRGMQIQGMRT